MRTLAAAVNGAIGTTVTVAGWVHRVRDLGGVTFVILRDRTGMVQLVFAQNPGVSLESVISATGQAQENAKAPTGVEVAVTAVETLGRAVSDLPIPVNGDAERIGIEAMLDHRLLSLRMPQVRHIFAVQAAILEGFAAYLRSVGFTEIKTSKLIGSGTEGGTGLFTVDYFGDRVYLAQSPQFYKQAMVASGMERVFEIGAAYRAEKHDTPRHLNEYVSLDVEMGFITDESDLMDLEAELLAAIFERVAVEREALDAFGATVPTRDDLARIPRMTYDDARAKVKEITGSSVFDINPEAERVLCDWALEEFGVEAIFVNAFPRKKRPFYTFPDGQKTRSFDLLFRGLEITTGGQRIHDYQTLLGELPRFGLTEEGLGDYCSIFRYGCPPHGGFAIGLERLTQKILGLQNVKEASLFPRDRKRVRP